MQLLCSKSQSAKSLPSKWKISELPLMSDATLQCMTEHRVPICLANAFPNEVWTSADRSSSNLSGETFVREKKTGVRFPDAT